MALDGVGEAQLIALGEGAEGARQCERQPAAIDPRGEFRGEAPRQGESPFDPLGLPTQELPDRGG
jgi:hypothetical protein